MSRYKPRYRPKKKAWKPISNEAAVDETKGIVARFDGSCHPNPGGEGTCACCIWENGIIVHEEAVNMKSHPGMSNNVAEFAGVVLILNWLIDNGIQRDVKIIGDSQVVINRMRSQTLPSGLCHNMAQTAISRLGEVRSDVTFHWQRRDKNEHCDAMADSVRTTALYETNPATC